MSSKGLGSVALFMIAALLVIVSVWIFFIFFKVHVTSIAVDVDSVNRYQEIPTTFLANTLRIKSQAESSLGEDIAKLKEKCEASQAQRRLRECDMLLDLESGKGNCFVGNGPAGPHNPNDWLCTKNLVFYYTKLANSVGEKVLSGGQAAGDLKNNLRLSLPNFCYDYSIKSVKFPDGADSLEHRGDSACDTKTNPKLSESYPLPVFESGAPSVIEQLLTIGSTVTGGEGLLVTWPRYGTCFDFNGECESGGGS